MPRTSDTPRVSKITRTITTGYIFDVFKKDGDNLVKVGQVTTESQPRSIKQQKEICTANGFDELSVLVLAGATEVQYEISEADFIKYATVVTKAQ